MVVYSQNISVSYRSSTRPKTQEIILVGCAEKQADCQIFVYSVSKMIRRQFNFDETLENLFTIDICAYPASWRIMLTTDF